MKRRGYFIAGTDTGVGKTRITVGLVAAWREAGERALGMKPVSAGQIEVDGRKINEDVLRISVASGIDERDVRLARYRLGLAASPHIGAQMESIRVDPERICSDFDELCGESIIGAVEGAGGWHAPIDGHRTMEAVAQALGLPVVLVVGLRLGCLSHAVLTADAIGRAGLRLAGWIANAIDPAMDSIEREANVAWLDARLAAPRLARLPFDARAGASTGLADGARALATAA